MTLVPGQLFIFGAATFVANSTSHLGEVETFTLGCILRFESMEYATDCHEELVFYGLASRQIQEQRNRYS